MLICFTIDQIFNLEYNPNLDSLLYEANEEEQPIFELNLSAVKSSDDHQRHPHQTSVTNITGIASSALRLSVASGARFDVLDSDPKVCLLENTWSIPRGCLDAMLQAEESSRFHTTIPSHTVDTIAQRNQFAPPLVRFTVEAKIPYHPYGNRCHRQRVGFHLIAIAIRRIRNLVPPSRSSLWTYLWSGSALFFAAVWSAHATAIILVRGCISIIVRN